MYIRLGAKSKITPKTRQLLKKWLWADYLLYDYFKNRLLKKIKNGIPQLMNNLKYFQELNQQLKMDCVIVKGDNKFLKGKFKMAVPIVFGYVINESKAGCDLYAISEPHFSFLIHDKQSHQ